MDIINIATAPIAYQEVLYKADAIPSAVANNKQIDSDAELRSAIYLGQKKFNSEKSFAEYLAFLEKSCPHDFQRIIHAPVKVLKVVDGDTIDTEIGRIRYIGIDTPETVHPEKGVESFGEAAKQRNRELVEGQTVQIDYDTDIIDLYGRFLGYVYLLNTNKTFVNLVLVSEGFALSSVWPPNTKYAKLFLEGQIKARKEHLGIWKNIPVITAEQGKNFIGSMVTLDTTITAVKKTTFRTRPCYKLTCGTSPQITLILMSLDTTYTVGQKIRVTGKLLAAGKNAYTFVIEDPGCIQAR